jgi:hypothetical protein
MTNSAVQPREIDPPASGMDMAEPPDPMGRPIPMPLDAGRCQKLWQNVLIAALEEMTSVADAAAYLRSKDGREVLALAGFDEPRVGRLDLSIAWARKPKTSAARIDQVARAKEKAAADAKLEAREAAWAVERAAQRAVHRDEDQAARREARAARREARAA